jgi:hypothetical protein
MTSARVRDPRADHLLTPQNAALLPIDYQPSPLATVRRTARNAPRNARREPAGGNTKPPRGTQQIPKDGTPKMSQRRSRVLLLEMASGITVRWDSTIMVRHL